MAGQMWALVTVCGLVAVGCCHASAEAQLLYNIDGSPRLEVINTGVPGQSQQGRFSWQAPKGALVWVQYPINQQGYVPWTPAEYSYSIASHPTKQVYPVIPQHTLHSQVDVHSQIPTARPFVVSELDTTDTRRTITNNNAQPYIQLEDESSNRGVARSPPAFRFNRRIDSQIPNNVQTIRTTTEKPLRTSPEIRRYNTLKFRTTTQRPLPSTTLSTTTTEEPEYTDIITDSPVEDVLPTARPFVVSEIETTDIRRPIVLTEVETTDIREYSEYTSESPVDFFTAKSIEDYSPTARPYVVDTYTVKSVEDALPTPRRIIKSEIETTDVQVDDRYVVYSNDEEVIPATESAFENNIYDDTDIIKAIVEANEQVEDTTELGPAIRYTSRGRKALFYETPQKLTNTHSNEEKYDNSPVPQPQLIEDQYLSQVNRPRTEVNTEIRNTPRRPSIRNRPVPRLIEDPSLRQSRRPAYRVNIENRPGESQVDVNTEIRNRVRRPGLKIRPGIRRIPVTDNNIATVNNQADEGSNRGIARRLSLSARLRNQSAYPTVRRT